MIKQHLAPLLYEQQPIYALALDDAPSDGSRQAAQDLLTRTVRTGPVAYELLYRGSPPASMSAEDWLKTDLALIHALTHVKVDCAAQLWFNLSSKTLANVDPLQLLKARENNPSLVAEWTEQESSKDDFDAARKTIHIVGKLGFPIVVDDFAEPGPDAISRMLSTNNLHGIKFAATFLAAAKTSIKHANVIQHISNLAAKQRWKLIVEGVETLEDFMLARTLGADYLQGFLFRPENGFPTLLLDEGLDQGFRA